MLDTAFLSMSASRVDAAWYLATYPDVAAAGMDPQEHYDRFGRAEGRLPRLLAAQALETRLWEGFAGMALPELEALYRAEPPGSDERSYAAWALARWHASHQDWTAASAFIASLRPSQPGMPAPLGQTLLHIEILLRLERLAEAQALLEAALETHGQLPDLCLAAANVCRFADEPAAGAGRLEWLDRLFTAAGLARIGKLDPARPLDLDNLTALEPLPALLAGPKISVIMPAFNAAPFIATALRSLLAQTWRNLEILVVDDCSSDDTAAIVTALAATDERVRLIRQAQNRGAYAARNAALPHASGDFITNHDSDDWSHPQRLERLADVLMAEPARMGVMAHWARADSALHFQRWRMEGGLIHPTVSTLMFRREVLERLGGWDEVRVGADTELWQRIKALYGAEAVSEVLPGVPLAFARQLPESLTSAPATHLRSQFFGMRRLYRELSQSWHVMAGRPNGLYLHPAAGERRFPAPSAMLRDPPPLPAYDLVLLADFGDYPAVFPQTRALLQQTLAGGQRVALFHWPDYRQPMPVPMAQHFLARAVEGQVDVLLPGQAVTADTLVILGRHLPDRPLDRLPNVRFRDCQVLELEEAPARLSPPAEEPATPDDLTLIGQSGLFCADWYLRHYDDVCQAGADPLQHYLKDGGREGRDPGPGFNSAHYLTQCPQAEASGWSPLLHYLKAGKRLGHEAGHPSFPGMLPHRGGRPTILLCGHAADHQLFGAERSLLDVLDAFATLAINVLVSVPSTVNPAYMNALQQRSHKVLPVPTHFWSATHGPCAWAVARFGEIILGHKVDAVQVNTIVLQEPLLAARAAGIPALVHARESLEHDADICSIVDLPAEQIRTRVLELADHVLANSAFTARAFDKPGATHIVANTVDPGTFDIPNTIIPERIDIALISSNLPKKGIHDLLAIARLLESSTPNARLLLIGPENGHIEAFKASQAAGELPANFILAGYAASPLEAISQANIVLNLSHFQETFGRTILEAMAARRPVLGYDWGALPELIHDGVNGFLLPLGDTGAVAERLHELCSDPQRIVEMGEAGRRIAQDRYSPACMARQMEQAYASVLSK